MRTFVAPGRVVGLDVARALALVAMMATHILPAFDGDAVSTSQQVAGGRASALFAVLAGVSVAVMSGRTSPHRGRQRVATSAGLAARALLVALAGLVLAEVDSGIAVILTYYGLLFLLALPFLGLRARELAALSGALLVGVPALSHLLRPHLPPPSMRSPAFDSLADPAGVLAELALTGYYPVLPWAAYLLAGMAVGRLDLTRTRSAVELAVLGAWLAVAATFASTVLTGREGVRRALLDTYQGPGLSRPMDQMLDRGFYGTTPTGSGWWLAVDAPHTATPFDLAHTTGTSLLVIGVALLAGRVLPQLFSVAFGAGAMTLTLYSAHVLVRADGWWDGDDVSTFVGQAVAVLAVGAAVRVARRRGPLEALVAAAQERVRRAAAPRPRR